MARNWHSVSGLQTRSMCISNFPFPAVWLDIFAFTEKRLAGTDRS